MSLWGCGGKPDGNNDEKEPDPVDITFKEYENFITDGGAKLPVSFIYGGTFYDGFSGFTLIKETKAEDGAKKSVILELAHPDGVLKATVEAAFYTGYGAYEWTVWFENVGGVNSGILRNVCAADISFEGGSPRLKGILGDHGNQYKPYDTDLQNGAARFISERGRPTHENFSYFNLETDKGGAMIAIGWPGTWSAEFTAEDGGANFKGAGNVGFSSYLKAGEKVRTPLMAFVRYYERDEDKAANLWRRWYTECNLPFEDATQESRLSPFNTAYFASDTGRPNSDGSISEGYDTWARTANKLKAENIDYNYWWIDAGWYVDSNGRSLVTDWTTTGTWELDKTKWPSDTLRQATDTLKEDGIKTLMWFEPERIRVSDLKLLTDIYGYQPEWLLPSGESGQFLTGYNNPDCVEWTFQRITKVMAENGIDMYREDFNLDPYKGWLAGDGLEGDNRNGITENLHVQGHLRLWDKIIAFCAENGKSTFIDSCASGGGRNDLESMRRAVPVLRSDSDRTTISLRLSMTTALVKWLPFTGMMAGERSWELDINALFDTYSMRGSYLPTLAINSEFNNAAVPYSVLRNSLSEWKQVSPYLLKDFYTLTPWQNGVDTSHWTAYMYFDAAQEKGVLQAFRPLNATELSYKVKFKGVNEDKFYKLTDPDGLNGVNVVSGAKLLAGLDLFLATPRSSSVLFIESVNA
jgi:alpha-galactosidase